MTDPTSTLPNKTAPPRTSWLIRLPGLSAHPPVQQYDLFILGAALVLIVLFLSKSLQFSLLGNLQILATSMTAFGIVAVGQTLVIITGGIDLSVGSVVALAGVITASLAASGINAWLAAGFALVIATASGWLQGLLISKFKLAPFVVTFGSLSLIRGLAQVISNGSPINMATDDFRWVWANAFGMVPLPVTLMAVIFLLTAYLLRNSRLGRYIYTIGSNETVATLSGINVNRTRQFVYAASGFLAGLAGLLMLARLEGGIYSSGQDYELYSIAAVIIGGTSLRGGTGGVAGTFAGVLLMSMLNNGLILFNAPPLWKDVITGGIIIGAALIDQQRRVLKKAVPLPASDTTVLPPPEITPATLEQAITKYRRVIKDRFEIDYVRFYLLDRMTQELVEAEKQLVSPTSLMHDAIASGKPLYANDLRRENKYKVNAVVSDVCAVAAVPILYYQRAIGVIELQTLKSGAFNESMLEAIMLVNTQSASNLEAYWLFERGWFSQQVREALRNIHDPLYLDKCSLGEWLLPGMSSRYETLKETLLDAVECVHTDQPHVQSRSARRYQILRQTYIDQKSVDAVVYGLGISRRQYFYDLKEAIDIVAQYLFSHYKI